MSLRFERFRGVRAVVLGDLMLDEYVFGRATRVSQEAPVLVIRQERTSAVPGGAANVATNMVALGASVELLGVVGDDAPGRTLCETLAVTGVSAPRIVTDPGRPTTRKTRVLANHAHQVLRIDHEADHDASAGVQAGVLAALERALQGEGVGVLLLSDYRKGTLPPPAIAAAIAAARARGIAACANAKPESIEAYAGASLVTLNRFEASEVLGREEPIEDEEAAEVARGLRERLGVERLVVTLGGSGMVCAGADGVARVPAIRVEVYDEAGAGDTVVATLALCAALGESGLGALRMAAHTAAAVVRKVGVAVPTEGDLREIERALASYPAEEVP